MLPLLTPVLGMLLALRDSRAQTVIQPDTHITVSEGSSLELRCNYSYGGTSYLFWYVQYPNQGLQLLLSYYSGNTLVKGIKDFEGDFKKGESFNLRKRFADWSDSAKYFCALSATVLGTVGGAEHKLSERLRRILNSETAEAALFLSRSMEMFKDSMNQHGQTDFKWLNMRAGT